MYAMRLFHRDYIELAALVTCLSNRRGARRNRDFPDDTGSSGRQRADGE